MSPFERVMVLKQKIKNRFKYIVYFIVSVVLIVIIVNNTVKVVFPVKYKDYIINYSVKNNIDPYLVFAIIKGESDFNPDAVSSKKAKGLMQISDKTGQWGAKVLKYKDYGNNSLFDPETNISIGCWYLRTLYSEFNNDLDLVLAAYNGGSGNVNEWLKDRDLSTSGKSLDKIPFKETENYLKKVKNYHTIYKMLYENSF
jgi:soluble lytic murein transglycosylase